MKKFTKLLLGLAFIGMIGVTTVEAASGTFGHNTTIGVTSGSVGSECYYSSSTTTAVSKAKCLENNKAIQATVQSYGGALYSVTSSGRNASYRYTAKIKATSNNDHMHGYSTWLLS